MRELRIAFMGTPEFAVASLEALTGAGFNVVAVVTAPDRPAGRGRKLKASAVKEYAVENQLPVFQPPNLKDPEFAAHLRELQVNLQVVVAFRMLPREIWSLPEYGTFNLHASLLPDYRGAAPINWALINGETQTGVTTFFIDEQIDTGNIILQESLQVGAEETAGELHDRLMALGAGLVVKTARLIQQGPVETTSQKEVESPRKAPKIFREDCRIHWDQTAANIHNHIRGLSPYPGAWTRLGEGEAGQTVKIFRTRMTDRVADREAGRILQSKNAVFVQASDAWLEVMEIQLEGKRRMSVQELLNGFEFDQGASFS